MKDRPEKSSEGEPKANPTIRAVLIGLGIVLLVALLTPLGMCVHGILAERKKKEQEKKAEVVRLCRSECIDKHGPSGSCDKERRAALKAYEKKANARYARLKRQTDRKIQAAMDEIGLLRKASPGKALPRKTRARIASLFKEVSGLQNQNLKLIQQKMKRWNQRFGELNGEHSQCVSKRLSACFKSCR